MYPCDRTTRRGGEVGLLSQICFFDGLHVTNAPIRLMCPTSVRPHFRFRTLTRKGFVQSKSNFDREIDHYHSWVSFEIGAIPSVGLSIFCPFVCPSTFSFPDSN